MSEVGLTTATEFHSGGTCPACQRRVNVGDPIYLCQKCGGASHASCWSHEQGCASYFCKREKRTDVAGVPRITVSREEAENLPKEKLLPPTSVYPEGREGRFPKRLSKLAVLSLPLGILSSLALAASILTLMSGIKVQGLGGYGALVLLLLAPLWLGCMALSIISLSAIANNSQLKGSWLAVTAIVLNLSVVIFIPVAAYNVEYNPQRITKFEFRDPPEALQNIEDPAIRNAMRANVVVHTSAGGFGGGVMTGSGVIVSINKDRTLLLTNRHVIDPEFSSGNTKPPAPARVEVIFCGKERVDATIKWTHPQGVDIALIECHPTDISMPAAVPLSLVSSLGIGADVFAVGNPLQHGWTYTKGVISSVRQKIVGDLAIKVFQTQTPINQGNSGGGLYDLKGQLVALNTWTLQKNMAEGINFSISIDAAAEVLTPLLSGSGKKVPVKRPAPDNSTVIPSKKPIGSQAP
jgi:S1-C subfamily serine protease